MSRRDGRGPKCLVLVGGRRRKFVPLWQVDDMLLKALENLWEPPPARRTTTPGRYVRRAAWRRLR